MAERKKTEIQTMIYKTLHRKQKILQHEPTQKNGVGGDSRAPEGYSVLAPQVAPVVLLLLRK